MKFANQAVLLALSMVFSSVVHAQSARPAACDRLNECSTNFDNNSCQSGQVFFDFAATQPTLQCGPYLAAQEALFTCFVAATCEVLNGPDACVAETTAANAFPPDVALFCLQNGPTPVVPPTAPQAWTCDPSFFGSNDGCDCGCVVADPDCATAALGSCGFNNCGGATPELDPANALACVPAECGNGSIGPDEQCDGGADCGADCTLPVDSPLTCDFAGVCHTVGECGDGFVDLFVGEACDDRNTAANDGCSATCTIEVGFQCGSEPSVCTITVCGNNILEGAESCEDGNAVANDGCSATCETEQNFSCLFLGRACRAFVCGDNNTEGTEECDDGNQAANDGCTATCTLEASFACIDDDLPCVATVCGDNVVDANEDCDDGNTTDEDGCSATCTTEPPPPDWVCGAAFYATNDGCDCGCGAADPDCASDALVGPGCLEASCNEDGCIFCSDSEGNLIGQAVAFESNDGCVLDAGEGEGEGEEGEGEEGEGEEGEGEEGEGEEGEGEEGEGEEGEGEEGEGEEGEGEEGEGEDDDDDEDNGREGEGEGEVGCSSTHVERTGSPAMSLLLGAATLMMARRRRS